MLKIEEGILKITDNEIKSSDTVLELQTELDCQIFGKLSFKNHEDKIIQFTKFDEIYKGRLLITQEDLPKLNGAQFFIVLVSSEMEEQTNAVQFKFNVELIKKDIRIAKSDELKNLAIEIAKLKSTIDYMEKGNLYKVANIINKDLIVPGMIPVAIDTKGNFAAAYPFANQIKVVNGQKAVNGVVYITAPMIKCNSGKDIESTLVDHASALQSLADALKVISDQQKDIIARLDSIDIRLTQHLNDGII